MASETETRPDDQVRAEDAERRGNDAVERRAISVGNVVRNRRNSPDADVERADTRGYYRDPEGRRRIVGAGQVVPEGWTRDGTADLEERRSEALAASGLEATGDGAEGAATKRSRSRSRTSRPKPGEDG